MKRRTVKLTQKDFLILNELRGDAKLSLKEMASRLELPRSTVHSRIKRMEELGVIRSYSVNVDYSKMGLDLTGFIMISFKKEEGVEQEELARNLAALPITEEVHIIAGEWDILMKVRMKSINELALFTVKDLKEMKGIGSTLTYVSLMVVKDHEDPPYIMEKLM